jgi:hypothetical protein
LFPKVFACADAKRKPLIGTSVCRNRPKKRHFWGFPIGNFLYVFRQLTQFLGMLP